MENKTRFSPRSISISSRIRPESEENLAVFCEKYDFKKAEVIDLLLLLLGRNTKKVLEDLKELQKDDYPGK